MKRAGIFGFQLFSFLEQVESTTEKRSTEKALIVELERVRTQGFALDSQENEQDGRCIAAPVFDAEHNDVAALSISGPLPRMKTSTAKAMPVYVYRQKWLQHRP